MPLNPPFPSTFLLSLNHEIHPCTPALVVSALCLGLAPERIYHNPVPPGSSPTTTPAPRDDWYATVQAKFDKYGDKPADIVFDGDSITNRGETTGKEYWAKHFAGRSADFGIEVDRVENLLWRFSKGQVDGINPKVVVLMIGTNNQGRDSAEEIAAGVTATVADYQKRRPNAHIILMGIFPHGTTASDGGRKKVATVNTIIFKLASDKVSYVDIGPKMLEPDGTIAKSTMPDAVHPEAKGYGVWTDAILPIIEKHTK